MAIPSRSINYNPYDQFVSSKYCYEYIVPLTIRSIPLLAIISNNKVDDSLSVSIVIIIRY